MIPYISIINYRHSPAPERKNEKRSRSKSKQPEEKNIQVWETNKDLSPPPRPKYNEMGENSNYNSRRRLESDYDRRPEDYRDQSYQYRDRHPHSRGRYDNHEYNRAESYYNRQNDRYGPGWRRPYRGGYRNQNARNPGQYGDGPSSRFRDEDNSRNKVKLVDY